MSQELLNIIISAVSVIVLGLASWAVSVLTAWLNTKIKDKKAAKFATDILTIVTDAVKAVYQSFVEVLKKNGKFDEAAQEEAKTKAVAIIKGQLTDELNQYIKDNFGDIDNFINTKIESVLYLLKNQTTTK